jgi:hypothetical protein
MNSDTGGEILSVKTVFGIQFGILLLLWEKAYLPPVTMVTFGAMVDKSGDSEQGLHNVQRS